MSVGGGLKINNQEVFSNAKFESNSAVEEEFNRLDIHAEYFSELRQRNYNLLDELIFAPAHFTLSSTCSPYVFSIEIKNPKSFQEKNYLFGKNDS